MEDIKDRLAIVIKEKNLKQVDLMDIGDKKFTQSAVNNWFTGKSKPSRNNLKRISDFLGVNDYWMRTGEGEKYIKSNNKNYIKSYDYPNGMEEGNINFVAEPILDNKQNNEASEYILIDCKSLLKMYYADIEAVNKLLQNKQEFYGGEIRKIK